MVVCVTGPMAAGKNAVSAILEKHGFACIDADLVGHRAVEQCRNQILEEFSPVAQKMQIKLVDEEGKIIRRNLGKIVFSDPELLKRHEKIVYGYIEQELRYYIEENRSKNVVINATVLYKCSLVKEMDKIIYVKCPLLIRLYRAVKRDRQPVKDILKRFRMQSNLFAKYKSLNADIKSVLNFGSQKKLESRVLKVL